MIKKYNKDNTSHIHRNLQLWPLRLRKKVKLVVRESLNILCKSRQSGNIKVDKELSYLIFKHPSIVQCSLNNKRKY